MWELVQVTAQYSQAVLLAILPHISDFSKKLDLPISTPITTNVVIEFKCDPRLGQTGGALTLSNGFQFAFLDGRVTLYRSPKSYFSLQDPELVPQFYGPVNLNETQALKVALGLIEKLGYEKSVFNANSAPIVASPEKIGMNYISRYRFRWRDPDWRDPISGDMVPALLDIEVNASSGEIEMMVNNSRDTRQPSPKVDVVPPLLHPKEQQQKSVEGTPTTPVSGAYAVAFLTSILPQVSDFITNVHLMIPVPITTNGMILTNYICRILDSQPIAQLYLTNGDRFNYEHGHVEAFYAHDAMDKFPESGRYEDFLGHINMTTDEAISMCADVIKKLGYPKTLPKPIVSNIPGRGSLVCTRYSFVWRHPGEDLAFASCEVDMETKTIKSIYLKDRSLEKPPPNIPFPAEANK